MPMSTTLIEVRRAKPSDAAAIAVTHDDAWRCAYQGVIPGPELDKLINRRGADWWDSAIRKGSRIAILVFSEHVAGYANYGRNRARSLYYDGEVYELYLRPEFQGLGFGRKLFAAVRRDLGQSGLHSLVIWALSDNESAVAFYRSLGGKAVARSSERFAGRLGSPWRRYLASAGVGTLGFIDYETVSLSNLHRQVIHGTPDIGAPKVDSAAATIRRLNPHVAIELHGTRLVAENALDLLGRY